MNALPTMNFGANLEVAVRSIVGARPAEKFENQDNYLLINGDGRALCLKDQQEHASDVQPWPAGHIRLAVMDGVGGHGHGREASESLAQGLLAMPPVFTAGDLGRALDGLHRSLQMDWPERKSRPGTTLVMLEIPAEGPALLAHVGDSRIYEIGASGAHCLTVDHAPPTNLAMQGLLTEGQWYRQVHEQSRSLISQALILGNTFSPTGELRDELVLLDEPQLPHFLGNLADCRPITLAPDRVYLLATDGLWALAEPARFVQRWPGILNVPALRIEHALDELFAELVFASAEDDDSDNATAVAIRVTGGVSER